VTYVRVTRDQRGYENTFLLHSSLPGEPPRVIYWYRSAPGVRVGRAALDEEAIRGIEEQHPEIDFDWPQLLEEASTATPEVERRPERRRRPARPAEAAAAEPAAAEPAARPLSPEQVETDAVSDRAEPVEEAPAAPMDAPRNALLEQLVGREIAERLRARYAEISARIQNNAQEATRAALQVRADALDPDRWTTVEAVLYGVQHADRLFEELRHDIA
jgi:hypothetical protein